MEQVRETRGLWREVWKRPDPQLAEAGFSGEYLVAGVRLLILLVLLIPLIPIYSADPLRQHFRLVLGSIGAALVHSLLMYSAVQRNWGRSWISFAGSLTDVTLVSGALFVFVLLEQPLAATNHMVIYPLFFLAIAATSLRYDSRICLVTGVAAMVQYAAVVLYAERRWKLSTTRYLPSDYGQFSWEDQVGRLVLLGAATLVATAVVVGAREARTLSIRDRLTGLLNRRFFEQRLHDEVTLSERSGRPGAVAMVDVDSFKMFNDAYGHGGGDEALRSVGETLLNSFRTTDVVARYGGEEFAILLPGIKLYDARRRLEALREGVASTPLSAAGRALPVGVTISIGFALWPQDGTHPDQLVRCADRRLYKAKERGRNRVVGPDDEAEEPERRRAG